MTKQAKQLTILAVVAVICVAGYGIARGVSSYQEAKASAASEAAIVHIGEIDDTINQIAYENSDGPFTLVLDSEGNWDLEEDAALPVDQSFATDLADVLTDMTAEQSLGTGLTLSDFGLDDPAYTVSVSDADGHSMELQIGNQASDGNYYAKLSDSDEVYVIATDLVSAVELGYYDIVDVETFPSLSENKIQNISIVLEDGTELVIDKETSEETTTDESGSTSTETVYTWYITGANGTRTPASDYQMSTAQTNSSGEEMTSQDEVDAIVTALSGMDIDSCVDYNASDETLVTYGLDSPVLEITVTYLPSTSSDETKTFTLDVGALTDDGDYYAVKYADSVMVNTMSASSVDNLLTAAKALAE